MSNDKIHAVTLKDIDVTGGFWAEKMALVREISMWNVYKRFSDTGRFDAILFKWKDGMPNKPHIFWDSDVAKWMEAAAYYCLKQRDPKFEEIIDSIVDSIEANRMADGYFNSYYEVIEPQNRFTKRGNHELYCAGHLIEAAVAYDEATGKHKFLELMIDYVNLIYKVFMVDQSAAFRTPGHEEIELALVKLYRHTGEKRFLDLALFFVNERGVTENELYNQAHVPVREQTTAVGHSVRACYLYCAIADLAKETDDESLKKAAETLFNNIVERRMYVTGAIGQTCVGEAFMGDFDLPNLTAYAETCANLSLALFARRLSVLEPKGVYADTAERVLYNSFLSGMSLDGRSFFYSNMQEKDLRDSRRSYNDRHRVFCPAPQRVEVFSCSCCPPNVVRTIASVVDFQYTTDGETIWCHQYICSKAAIDGSGIEMRTEYPYEGRIAVSFTGTAKKLALRIPGWCQSFSFVQNGDVKTLIPKDGYVTVAVNDGDELYLDLHMPVRFVEADPRVWDDAGRVCVTRGPLVYCIEAVDNAADDPLLIRDIRLVESSDYKVLWNVIPDVPVLETEGYVRNWSGKALYDIAAPLEKKTVRLIPYFAMANRGESDMVLWTLRANA